MKRIKNPAGGCPAGGSLNKTFFIIMKRKGAEAFVLLKGGTVPNEQQFGDVMMKPPPQHRSKHVFS